MSLKLTPTQDLVMELLAARHRLGHTEWPVDTRFRKALERLYLLNLVTYRSGNVEKTYLASLTQLGKNTYLSPTYRSSLSEAWDEGFEAGHEYARAVNPKWPRQPRNPYRSES